MVALSGSEENNHPVSHELNKDFNYLLDISIGIHKAIIDSTLPMVGRLELSREAMHCCVAARFKAPSLSRRRYYTVYAVR